MEKEGVKKKSWDRSKRKKNCRKKVLIRGCRQILKNFQQRKVGFNPILGHTER
jgi:hypothetical protein